MDLQEALTSLTKLAEKDMIIDKTALTSAALDTPTIYAKWLRIHMDVKRLVRERQFVYDTVYRDRWMYYNGKATPADYKKAPFDLKVLKGDLGVFLQSDEELGTARAELEDAKNLQSFVEGVVSELGRRSFHIKNALDAIRWENGG